MASVYDFSATTLSGEELSLSAFRGQVLLIVNTASRCAFTPQYEGLQALHKAHAKDGFSVLGFPCNQFNRQEPGSADDIASFCSLNYEVSFPMFVKIDVNGAGAHPLYRYLKKEKPGLLGSQAIKWNFTKFLVDRQGRVASRYATAATPKTLSAEIETLLRRPAN